ncbi:hypothetical protein I4F81_012852 [Pyropia yezoensis]|uniref:Uncharacterized protein n=1 Tax=Pyropia yezoensis TaxID=2788 RepID=A0ACC3CJI4_PYRYE|nr:hypothetical protein I4F81_012852 [Neopyropia yezoensis]
MAGACANECLAWAAAGKAPAAAAGVRAATVGVGGEGAGNGDKGPPRTAALPPYRPAYPRDRGADDRADEGCVRWVKVATKATCPKTRPVAACRHVPCLAQAKALHVEVPGS